MAKKLAASPQTVAVIPTKLVPMNQKVSLLFLVAIAAVAALTGVAAFKLGDEALKGVTSPEINPAQKLIEKKSNTAKAGETQPLVPFKPLNIKKVEKDVDSYIAKQQKLKKTPAKNSKNAKENAEDTKGNSKKNDAGKKEADVKKTNSRT